MKTLEQQQKVSRIITVLWGFVFIQLFRFALNQLHPYWAGKFSLSFFGFLILVISLVSFWWFSYTHREKRKKSVWFGILTLANTLIFIATIIFWGNDSYLNILPLFYTLQLFLQFFILSAKIPLFLNHRLEISVGVIFGLVDLSFFQEPIFLITLSALIAIFPNRLLSFHEQKLAGHKQRMQPLRMAIDVARFLFLGFALYGILDKNRQYFYVVLLILIIGSVLQFVILRLDQKRHHIKYGIGSLALIFVVIGAFFNQIDHPYLFAFSYSVLVIWEALYFKKSAEGYLKREQYALAFAIFCAGFSYFITKEWSIILIAVCLIGLQLYIFRYILKSYRQIASIVFAVSVLVWGISAYRWYKTSLTNDFWEGSQKVSYRSVSLNSDLPDNWFVLAENKQTVVSNSLASGLAKKISNDYTDYRYDAFLPVWLTAKILLNKLFGFSPHTLYLINLQSISPYDKADNRQILTNFIGGDADSNIIFVEKNPDSPQNAARLTNPHQILQEQIKQKLQQALSPSQERFQLLYLSTLGPLQVKANLLEKAEKTYLKLIERQPGNAHLLKELSEIYSGLKNIKAQIDALKQYIRLEPQKSLETEKLLIELYYYAEMKNESESLTNELLQKDRDNAYVYLRWLFKLYAEGRDKFKFQVFYQKILYFNTQSKQEEIEKNNLLSDIQQAIKATPGWGDVFDKDSKNEESSLNDFDKDY